MESDLVAKEDQLRSVRISTRQAEIEFTRTILALIDLLVGNTAYSPEFAAIHS
jgi:hypothetical protein